MTPYVQEVLADEPVGLWRLSGAAPGAIQGDPDGAMDLTRTSAIRLAAEDFHGQEFAVEMWARGVEGTILSYGSGADSDWFRLEYEGQLVVTLLGDRRMTGVRLAEGRWQHVGTSWRSDTGDLVVSLDGQEAWHGRAKRGAQLQHGGQALIGGTGKQKGFLDEVALFDRFLFPSTWLHRVLVARGRATPSPSDATKPFRFEVQDGPSASDAVWSPDGTKIATLTQVSPFCRAVGLQAAATGNHVTDLIGSDGR
jgi:hypothetical protein